MRSLQILACLLLVCGSIGRTISAFASIHQLQQQQQQSKSGLLSIAPITTSNTIVTNQLSLSAMILHNSLRAGAGGSIKSDDASLLGRYARWVDEKPLLAKSMTAGIVTTIANLFSQIFISSQSPQSLSTMISGRRVVMHMLTGICFIGPYLHVWYGYLDKVLAMPQQKRATRTVTKVIVDQSIGLCIFFPLYFTFLEIAESILLGRGTYQSKYPRGIMLLHFCSISWMYCLLSV